MAKTQKTKVERMKQPISGKGPKKGDGVPINTRISEELYKEVEKLLSVTKKTKSAFVADCIITYLDLVYGNEDESNCLKIDRFALSLEDEES